MTQAELCAAMHLPPRLAEHCRRDALLAQTLALKRGLHDKIGLPGIGSTIIRTEPPAYLAHREAECAKCQHNKAGVCLKQMEKTPGRPCLVYIGIRRPNAQCPLEPPKWLAQPSKSG